MQKTKSWLGMNEFVRREAENGVYSAEYTLKKLVHNEFIKTDQLIYFPSPMVPSIMKHLMWLKKSAIAASS